jgi:hypothetical protein
MTDDSSIELDSPTLYYDRTGLYRQNCGPAPCNAVVKLAVALNVPCESSSERPVPAYVATEM